MPVIDPEGTTVPRIGRKSEVIVDRGECFEEYVYHH